MTSWTDEKCRHVMVCGSDSDADAAREILRLRECLKASTTSRDNAGDGWYDEYHATKAYQKFRNVCEHNDWLMAERVKLVALLEAVRRCQQDGLGNVDPLVDYIKACSDIRGK